MIRALVAAAALVSGTAAAQTGEVLPQPHLALVHANVIDVETGALEPGLEADLIGVEQNPLEDIRVVQDVIMVVSNGRVALKRLPFARTE